MDQQPGQAQIPQDQNQKPPEAQPQNVGGVQNAGYQYSPADQAPDEPTLPPVANMQQPAPEDSQSFYSPDGTDSTDDGQQDAAGWQFSQEAGPGVPQSPQTPEVSWTASEFIEHPKGFGWYLMLGFAGLVVAGLNFMFTKDIVSTAFIVVAAILFGVYAGHKPRQQEYHLSSRGLQIGGKLYVFQTFKAFSVAEEGSIASIVFTPLGRFAPPLTIYVGHDMEDKVLDYLSNFLPLEQRRIDAVDGLLRKIRF